MPGEGVAQVGEPGVFCADAVGQFQGLVQGEVGVMGMITHGVKGNVLQALQFGEFAFRDGAHIRNVGNVAKAETQHRQLVVQTADGYHVGLLMGGLQDGVVGGFQATVGLPIEITHIVHPFQIAGAFQRIYAEGTLVNQVHVPLRGTGVLVVGKGV